MSQIPRRRRSSPPQAVAAGSEVDAGAIAAAPAGDEEKAAAEANAEVVRKDRRFMRVSHTLEPKPSAAWALAWEMVAS